MQEREKEKSRGDSVSEMWFSASEDSFIDFGRMTKGSTYLLDGSWTYTSVPHPGGWPGWKSSGPRSTGTSAGGSPGRSTGGQRKPQSQKRPVMHRTLCVEAFFRVVLTSQSTGIAVFLNRGSTLTCFGVQLIDNYQKFWNLCHLSRQGCNVIHQGNCGWRYIHCKCLVLIQSWRGVWSLPRGIANKRSRVMVDDMILTIQLWQSQLPRRISLQPLQQCRSCQPRQPTGTTPNLLPSMNHLYTKTCNYRAKAEKYLNSPLR